LAGDRRQGGGARLGLGGRRQDEVVLLDEVVQGSGEGVAEGEIAEGLDDALEAEILAVAVVEDLDRTDSASTATGKRSSMAGRGPPPSRCRAMMTRLAVGSRRALSWACLTAAVEMAALPSSSGAVAPGRTWTLRKERRGRIPAVIP